MKYRVKVEVRNDLVNRYTPQVKRSLFGKWENIVVGHFGVPDTSLSARQIYDTEQEACDVIEKYKETIIKKENKKIRKIYYKYK